MKVRLSLQREKILVFITLIAVASCYKEQPHEYEDESVSHIDYEKDQMPIKFSPEGSNKVKRMATYSQSPSQYEYESVQHAVMENNQTPAEDRNWQVKPKVKRMSSKSGRKVHIYLKNEDQKPVTQRKPSQHSPSNVTTTTFGPTEDNYEPEEVTTRKAPELTTRADRDVRRLKHVDTKDAKNTRDSVGASSTQSKQAVDPTDSQTEGSDHYDQVIKEKIKIKHHHHHHHHNHVKTVVKKEPYPGDC